MWFVWAVVTHFVGTALLAEPDLFDAFLAVSPYLMYADNLAVKETSEKLKPFGTRNPEPVFLARNVAVDEPKIVGENHRRMLMSQPGGKRSRTTAPQRRRPF